ncbi:MFS transporter [Pendulispora albinea]|uniref:MFS transporter n=1 Tax=Pendulispora albinea TaxID=2741071 RepID=A0ABZ2LMI9_9BACT
MQSSTAAQDPTKAEPAERAAGELRKEREPRARRWQALAVLLTGNFVTVLDLFIVNVALDSIRKELHASLADVQLVLVGYSAAYGVLLMNGARLGDLFGRRRMFLVGMGLFTVASALCGLAQAPGVLIGARALQGIGAALLMPQVYASLRVSFEGEERRRAFSIMGAVQGVAASISQLAGGLLIEHGLGGFGWRLVFLINVPIGIAAVVAGRARIVETRAPVPAKLDVGGAVLAALGLVLLLVPFMEGREYGWPWWSIAAPALSVPLFVYFVRHEKALSTRGGVPIIEMALFRNTKFVTGVAAVFLFYSSISSFFLSLTMLLQTGLGMSPLAAGAVFTPSAIAFFAASLAGPRLSRVLGGRALLLGVLVFTTGLGLSVIAGAVAPEDRALVISSLVLNGAGQGLVIPLALEAVLSRVGDEHAGMGAGALTTMQVVGSSVGVALVGVLFFSMIGEAGAAPAGLRAVIYGHAFAKATLYNIAASLMSLVMFALLLRKARRPDHAR